jgi:hypothetical protein
VFGELGTLPKIREEIVSELQMVFEFFQFTVDDSVIMQSRTNIEEEECSGDKLASTQVNANKVSEMLGGQLGRLL